MVKRGIVFENNLSNHIAEIKQNIYRNLTDQINSPIPTDIFDVGEKFKNLRVLLNGKIYNHKILSEIGTTFQLDFIPKKTDHLAVIYDRF